MNPPIISSRLARVLAHGGLGDSITASAPSNTADATSLASARVGRVESIIDCSISVATITGVCCRRQLPMISFCTTGTVRATARRPDRRAPPSRRPAAATTSHRLSTASGVSIFATIGVGRRLLARLAQRDDVVGPLDERQRDVVDAQRRPVREIAAGPDR
jgi:hypothetical protein